MAAEHSASSQRRSYADQYLGQGAQRSDPESEPYGYWYAERLRRAGEGAPDAGAAGPQPYREDPADFSRHREDGLRRTIAAEREPETEYDTGNAVDPKFAGPEFAGPDFAGPDFAGPEFADTEQGADAGIGSAAAAAEPAREPVFPAHPPIDPGQAPVAGAPAANLSPATYRQLDQNADQLSLIEGNLVSAAQTEVSTVYVTSCFRGEGKTTAALSTAYGLSAISQARVLLVDGGNTSARLHSMLAIQPYPGLTEAIEGRVQLSDALHPVTGLPGLHVLTCGAVSHAILSEAQRVDRIKAFLDTVKPHYDFIVVDGSSTFASSDPTRLASCFDGVMFVVACERTKWEVVQGAVEKVRSGGGTVLGGVLNRRRYYIPRIVYQWISR
jgi:Mrp family chromosome partitioning ATPase